VTQTHKMYPHNEQKHYLVKLGDNWRQSETCD